MFRYECVCLLSIQTEVGGLITKSKGKKLENIVEILSLKKSYFIDWLSQKSSGLEINIYQITQLLGYFCFPWNSEDRFQLPDSICDTARW